MALTQAQIDAFEKMRVGYWDRIFGKTGEAVLTGEQYTLLALRTISDQLATLTQAMTGKQPSVTAVGGDLIPQVTIDWPLDPKRLNETLLITDDLRGYITVNVIQFPVAVLAGGSTTFAIPPPPGNVAILTAPLEIVTDNVGAQVVVTASIDGHDAIGQMGFMLGPSTNLAIHQYYVAQSTGMLVSLTNTSPNNVTIWFKGELMTMARIFYDNFYAPAHVIAFKAVSAALGLSV